MQPDVTPKGWRIVSQEHHDAYTGNGTFEPVVTVYYMTDSGTRGHVDFPEARYNLPNVVARLNELVDRIHTMAALGNE
jgi:hypothetical protein